MGGFLPTRSILQEVSHGKDVAIARVKHNDSPTARVVLLDGAIKVPFSDFLHRQVNGETNIWSIITGHVVITVDPQRATKGVAQCFHMSVNWSQFLVEGEFHAGLAGVLESDFANQLIGKWSGWIVAHQFGLKPHAVNIKLPKRVNLRFVNLLGEYHVAALGIFLQELVDRLWRQAQNWSQRNGRVAERVTFSDRILIRL